MTEFKIGDEIFHKSNSSVTWVIESIENGKVSCSTVMKDTLEQKKDVFIITSIEKCADPTITYGRINRRDNNW